VNLNQLKLFYLAVKRGSLSAAANELNITQPAVSKGIKRLQEHYEVRFVERLGNRLVLTRAGEALFNIAEQIFSMEKMAEESIRSFQVEGGRQLRIHASESFGAYYLPSLINQFKTVKPGLGFKVDIVPTEKVVENTLALQNDVGFISYPVDHKKLILTEVLEERLVFIISPRHPLAARNVLAPRDLEGQAMIMHEQGSALQKTLDAIIGQNKVHVSKYLEFSNNEAIKRAVAEGDGIALISEKVVDEEIRAGKLKAAPLSGAPLTRKFYMVRRKEQAISRLLSDFLEMLAQWAQRYSRDRF